LVSDNEEEGPTSILNSCFLISFLAFLSFLLIWIHYFVSQMLASLLIITGFLVVVPVYCLIRRAKDGRTRFEEISSRAASLSESYEESASQKFGHGVRYIFPSQCPECNEQLDPGGVKWIDRTSAICPNCRTTVRVSTQEI
jgi:hypothetical protein